MTAEVFRGYVRTISVVFLGAFPLYLEIQEEFPCIFYYLE